jgi:MSHA biogenesis protein MshI
LALELQRTFDYYESHSRQSPISQLVIISNEQPLEKLAVLLQQRLGIDCIGINIPDILTLNENIANIDHKCITAIGGALRGFS